MSHPLPPVSMLSLRVFFDLLSRGAFDRQKFRTWKLQLLTSTLHCGGRGMTSLMRYAIAGLSETILVAWIFTCENSADNRLKSYHNQFIFCFMRYD